MIMQIFAFVLFCYFIHCQSQNQKNQYNWNAQMTVSDDHVSQALQWNIFEYHVSQKEPKTVSKQNVSQNGNLIDA
jgi:hypothetical protein